MRLPRIGRDCAQLRETDTIRYSNRKNLDPVRLCPVRFEEGPFGVDVCPSVGHENENFRNADASAVLGAEHAVVRDAECRRYVRITAGKMQISDRRDDAVFIVVGVETKLDIDPIAEEHYSNLRQLPRDGERVHDGGGEAEHADIPVVVPGCACYDTCGLIQHQHNISRPRTCHVI